MSETPAIRLLFVITDSGIGGSERVLTTLLRSLDPHEFRVQSVVVLKTIRELGLEWKRLGIPVLAMEMGRLPSFSIKRKLERIIREYDPDIVHSFLFHSAQYCRLVSGQFPKIKFISSPRVNYRFLPAWARGVDRLLCVRDSVALAESESTMNYLQSKMGYPKSKVQLARNGVDTELYRFSESARIEWREAWGVKESDVLIGAMGRLHHQKGFDVLLKAIHRLSGVCPQARWVVVGEGPLKENLINESRQLGLNVLFAGRISPSVGVYSAFDIFVQSSRYEGLSNALLEAMSVGLPLVATAVDGTLDVARHGENGLLVEPENPVALAESLESLILNQKRRQILGEAARRTAEFHSLQKMIERYQEIYREINSNDSTC